MSSTGVAERLGATALACTCRPTGSGRAEHDCIFGLGVDSERGRASAVASGFGSAGWRDRNRRRSVESTSRWRASHRARLDPREGSTTAVMISIDLLASTRSSTALGPTLTSRRSIERSIVVDASVARAIIVPAPIPPYERLRVRRSSSYPGALVLRPDRGMPDASLVDAALLRADQPRSIEALDPPPHCLDPFSRR